MDQVGTAVMNTAVVGLTNMVMSSNNMDMVFSLLLQGGATSIVYNALYHAMPYPFASEFWMSRFIDAGFLLQNYINLLLNLIGTIVTIIVQFLNIDVFFRINSFLTVVQWFINLFNAQG